MAVLAKLSAPLHANEDLINCGITLPHGETVRFNLTVCFVESLPWAKHSVIGGRFSTISPQDQRRLSDFLMDLERQMLRDDR
jgi:c-di-GMP-binding flagellar brake protein YcgR